MSIGSATKKIHLVPDYLFEVNNRYSWVLDAKSPREDILKTKYVEQAYSYAVNSEVRVPYFALCNGKQFVLYHISIPEPILNFHLQLISSYWGDFQRLLNPKDVLKYDFGVQKKDFGLHLKRLGFDDFKSLIFYDVSIMFIDRIAEDLYTFAGDTESDEERYVVSFDFDYNTMIKLKDKIHKDVFDALTSSFDEKTVKFRFVDIVYRVTVDCRIGNKLEETETEIFQPFWVNDFLY